MRLAVPCAVLLTASVLTPGAASADIYRCVGADGSLEFTNVRPRGRRCTLIARESSGGADGGGAAAAAVSAPRASRSSGPRDPNRYTRYDAHIREAANLYQLPEAFIRAVIKVESDFNPEVVSHAGAMGLMQLMPRTAESMGVRSPFDPRENILGGTRYLRILANRFNGDLVLTVAAYNAGEGAVQRYRGVPPYQETRRYVRRVLRFYYTFRARTVAG